jgi:hypothetical protein
MVTHLDVSDEGVGRALDAWAALAASASSAAGAGAKEG